MYEDDVCSEYVNDCAKHSVILYAIVMSLISFSVYTKSIPVISLILFSMSLVPAILGFAVTLTKNHFPLFSLDQLVVLNSIRIAWAFASTNCYISSYLIFEKSGFFTLGFAVIGTMGILVCLLATRDIRIISRNKEKTDE